MKLLLYLIFLSFTLGQLGRISLYNQQVNFYLYEIGMVVFIFISLIKFRFKPLRIILKKYRAIYIFFTLLLVSIINNFIKFDIFANIVGLFYLLRLVMYAIFGIYLSIWSNKIKEINSVIKSGINIMAVITIFTTSVQYFLYPDLRNLFYLGWDPHLFRTFGVFFDTAISGSIYALFLLTNSHIFIKIIYLVFIVLNFSRSIYLSLAAVLVYFIFAKVKLKKLFIYSLFFLILLYFAPKPAGEGVNLFRTFSITSRLEDYKEGITLFKKSPIIGYGYNRLRYIRENPDNHAASAFSSSYLTILVSAGLLGLFGFISILTLIWKKNKKYRSLIVFIVIMSFFDNVLLHPMILFLTAVILSDKSK